MTSLHTAMSEGCLGQFSEMIFVPFGPGTLIIERTQISASHTNSCKPPALQGVVRILEVMRTLGLEQCIGYVSFLHLTFTT